MKSIEEQTREAAEKHYKEWNKYPSNGVKDDCIDDFIAGAEWERSRGKWIPISELPPVFKPNPNFSINVLVTDGERIRFGYYHFNGYWYGDYMNGDKITHWMPLPEPPKQKEVQNASCKAI